jgi:hypothetical protein
MQQMHHTSRGILKIDTDPISEECTTEQEYIGNNQHGTDDTVIQYHILRTLDFLYLFSITG